MTPVLFFNLMHELILKAQVSHLLCLLSAKWPKSLSHKHRNCFDDMKRVLFFFDE